MRLIALSVMGLMAGFGLAAVMTITAVAMATTIRAVQVRWSA